MGTVGGTVVRHNFPLDGDYLFQLKFFRTNLGMMRGLEYPHTLEYTIDGARVHVATIGGNDDLAAAFEKPTVTADAMEERFRMRVPVTAGPHDVGVTFVEDLRTLDTTRLQPYLRSSFDTLDWTGRPHIDMFSITGPFNPSGVSKLPSRRNVFICHPAKANEEAACAERIVSALLRRAYRHEPVSPSDVRRVMAAFRVGRRNGSFARGVQTAIQYVLASPKFVFRSEDAPASVVAGAPFRLNNFDLASGLSFFLWSSVPDDELRQAAATEKLASPEAIDREVVRMLGDPKASALTANFAGQWLQLRNVRAIAPNSELFPDFDDNLRQAFQRETELFFESIVHEDRSALDLLRADYTFVNGRLAKHYGIPGIYGSHFRRVTVPDEARRGLLGQASILAITSKAERTSPVVRGKWILDNILGTPPPPPPPDVPTLKDNDQQKPRTMREQMAEHRANPVCASCHKAMDPIGFALENFDAVGAWRSTDAGTVIDASGELADGSHVDGVNSLRKALLARPDVFVGTLTEKLLTYALGRGLDAHDMPTVRAIVREAAAHDYKFSSLIVGIVNSRPFQYRMKSERNEVVARTGN